MPTMKNNPKYKLAYVLYATRTDDFIQNNISNDANNEEQSEVQIGLSVACHPN